MSLPGYAANQNGKPIIFDPVAVGASDLRRTSAQGRSSRPPHSALPSALRPFSPSKDGQKMLPLCSHPLTSLSFVSPTLPRTTLHLATDRHQRQRRRDRRPPWLDGGHHPRCRQRLRRIQGPRGHREGIGEERASVLSPSLLSRLALLTASPLRRLFDTGCIVVMTGEVDWVSDGEKVVKLSNGNKLVSPSLPFPPPSFSLTFRCFGFATSSASSPAPAA